MSHKTRECPSCAMEVERVSGVCPICGYEFPRQNSVFKYVVWLLVILLAWPLIRFVLKLFGI